MFIIMIILILFSDDHQETHLNSATQSQMP